MPGCYNATRGPGRGPQPGVERIQDYVLSKYGYHGVSSWGIYNPRRISGSRKWSLHAEGRAVDLHIPYGKRSVGDEIFYWAINNADGIGLQEILWWGKIWSHQRSYVRGASGHYDHVHLGLCWAGANGHTPWFSGVPQPSPAPAPTPDPPEPKPPEEEDVLRFLKTKYSPTVWATNGIHRRSMASHSEMRALIDAGLAKEGVVLVHPDVLRRIKR